MQGSTLADIDYPDFSFFIFKVYCTFMEEKDNSVQKVVIDKGELDDIKIFGILGLENLPRAVLID